MTSRIFFHVKTDGITRWVLLIGPWAIKFPRFFHFGAWTPVNGLTGMLGNMTESRFGHKRHQHTKWKSLCPVLLIFPLGLCIVMRRAEPLTDDEWSQFCPKKFNRKIGLANMIEGKRSSFGKIGGEIVAVDYAG